jgi:hypothetical protein
LLELSFQENKKVTDSSTDKSDRYILLWSGVLLYRITIPSPLPGLRGIHRWETIPSSFLLRALRIFVVKYLVAANGCSKAFVVKHWFVANGCSKHSEVNSFLSQREISLPNAAAAIIRIAASQ